MMINLNDYREVLKMVAVIIMLWVVIVGVIVLGYLVIKDY